MRRWIAICLSALCLFGLVYCGWLYGTLSGQSLFRLTTLADENVLISLDAMADEMGLELGAFTIEETQIDGLNGEGVALYECLAFHPEAIGILMIDGSPITSEQIQDADRVIMLSETLATQISPSLDCIGKNVSLGGELYRVVGIYRHYEPLAFLTRTAEASAIIPLRDQSMARTLYVWTRSSGSMQFSFSQVGRTIEPMNAAWDMGAYQSIDLDRAERMSLQSIRFWLLLWLSLFSWRAYQTLRSKRRLFTEAARNAFAQLYPGRALLSLLWPFAKWIVPSLAVLAGWGAYLVYCANHLLIDAQRVPEALFSPGAWLARQASFYLASNQVEGMPVYSYLLNGHLHGMILTLGLLSVCFLWIGLKKGSGKSCGVRTQTSVHEKARPEDLESF